MTREELEEAFSDYELPDDYNDFSKVKNPRHPRPDIHAFLLLHDLVPTKPHDRGWHHEMVSAAEHDVIYLNVDLDELAEVATPEVVRDLQRCGVHLDAEVESLAMFV